MRAVLFLTAAVFALGLSACTAGPPPTPSASTAEPATAPSSVRQATATGIQPLDKKKFGEAITESTTTPLPAIMKDPSSYTNKTVRTEGMVSAVCQSMGCWMQIADTSGKAHVRMAGHSFFVPKTASGHRAVVQGKVVRKEPENACGGDGCGNNAVAQVQIEATGVEFID